MSVRVRFAPSPTGVMHLGSMRTALYTYLFARKNGGTFILRIEDTDQEREVAGATEKIYRDLRAIGLEYDEGPDIGGPCGPYIQSQRLSTYRPHVLELWDRGRAYPCFCTSEDIDAAKRACEAKGETYRYDKRCAHLPRAEAQRRIDAGEPHVFRQNVPDAGVASFDDLIYGHIEVGCDTLEDMVLLKSDGFPTYNFANVIDDHGMGITHVIRGSEYLSSSPKYNLLYDAFGWQPPQYIHLPTVLRDAHQKLSKRLGDPSYDDLIQQGYLREAVINYLALLGWNPGTNEEFFTLEGLVEAFDVSGISKSPSIFDKEKLTWFNAEYIRRLSPEAYRAEAEPWLRAALPEGRFDIGYLCALLQPRTEVFDRLPGMVSFLVEEPVVDPALYGHKKMKTDAAVAERALAAAIPALEDIADWTQDAIHARLIELASAQGLKNGQVLWPLRVALSARESTPAGAIEIAVLLGRDETLRRARKALEALRAG